MCSITDPLSCPSDVVGDVVGDAASGVAGNAIEKFAEAVSEAVGETIKQLATVWTKVPSVNVDQSSTVENTQASLWWYMALVAVLGCVIGGARMASQMRAQPLKDVVQSLATLILITGCGVAAVQLCLEAGDSFSGWVLQDAGGPAFGKKMTALLAALSTSGLGSLLVIVVGLTAIISGLTQLVLMVFRDAILVLLCGVWPLSAAAINTSWGRQWFQRISGWIVAFVLYKPAAALIYAASFEAFGTEKGLRGALIGAAMMLLTVFALPALMRLCVPMVGGMGSTGGGMAAGAALAGASSMISRGPSGAVDAPSSPASGGGSQGGGPSGADTASGSPTSPGGATSSPAAGVPSGAGAASAAGSSPPTGAGAAMSGAGASGAGAGAGAAASAGPVGAALAAGKGVYDAAQTNIQSVANEEGPNGSGQ